jgi:N-acetylglucosamine kinase-like BadF-type ATPase
MGAKRRDDTVVIGVDAGATWVRVAVLRKNGRAFRIARNATAVPDLRKFLLSALRRRAARLRAEALVVATRGVWTQPERARIARKMRGVARRVEVISDAEAALLGALDDRPGVLVLAGTGSIVLGRDERGRWTRAGGLGPLLGDEGSGFWLGREWLRATTGGEDFLPVRRLVQSPDPVARIAALAPSVLRRARRGHPRAADVVRRAADHLAAQAADVARRLRLRAPIEMSWAGSVMGDTSYRRAVARAVARRGVRAQWSTPRHEAVVAATRRAARIARWKDL